MKILIISDSHGNLSRVLNLAEKYKDYTKIHLGDRGFDSKSLEELGFYYVDGNCDYTQSVKTRICEIDGKRFLLTHGDLYNVRNSINNLYYLGLENKCDYVLFGHTHVQFKEIGDISFINPGALKDNHYCVIEDDIIKFF
ncbi:MAG: YfcE family phosphodiesterase [Acholeplasmatales bacterium]|nr:YfcE family phosphodiesterase [Acholeplasmatales bacterium]